MTQFVLIVNMMERVKLYSMNECIVKLIFLYSSVYNIDPMISLSIAKVESNFNPNAIGKLGEIGLYQLRPEFVSDYSKEELFNIENNISIGIRKLKEVKNNCYFKDKLNWLICYNYGYTNSKSVKYPEQFPYIKKVNKELVAFKKIYGNN